MTTPLVVDIKRNCLDDGPGIRSVVFFKGCPLACVWCQNPECLSPGAQLQPLPQRCLGCGQCVAVCPQGLAVPGDRAVDCTACGQCVSACPAGTRRIAGERLEVEELVGRLARDKPFYRRSGGGVTLSGGEPLLYPSYVGELAARLAGEGIQVLAETAGHFDFEPVARQVLGHLAAIYFDLKLADPQEHRLYTGQTNERILDNLRRLAGAGRPELLVRVPLVPGITDRPANLSALARLIAQAGLDRVVLLAYNPLWLDKRRALGLEMPYAQAEFMSPTALRTYREHFERAGIEVMD